MALTRNADALSQLQLLMRIYRRVSLFMHRVLSLLIMITPVLACVLGSFDGLFYLDFFLLIYWLLC